MRSPTPLFLALALTASAAGAILTPTHPAASAPIFTLDDPRDDDHGDGTLLYPVRDDLAPGDLDLVSITARPEKDGTLFEATFARPVRVPGRQPIDAGGTALERVARFGFYTLNLDVYVDTDRVAGSGRTAMLPGRRAEADSSTAWERMICVTPRPYEAREGLKKMRLRAAKDSLERSSPRVDREDLERIGRSIEIEIDSTVYFPTRTRAVGRGLQFFVPGSFLGGAARDTWAYVVAVSGADILQRFDLGTSLLIGKDFSEGLMILPVGPGRPRDRFGGGRENDDVQPWLVDVLIAPGVRQEDALRDYDRRALRAARLRGVVPAEAGR
jgi:hypothetical protein